MVKNKKYLLGIGLLVAIITSCGTWYPLTIPREPNKTTKLRLQGYYYSKIRPSCHTAIFLFENGILIRDGACKEVVFPDAYDKQIDQSYSKTPQIGENMFTWGAYIIKEDSIILQKWEQGSGGEHPRFYFKGKILSDTCFYISLEEGKEQHRIDTFYFHYLPIKPDSTNRFIK